VVCNRRHLVGRTLVPMLAILAAVGDSACTVCLAAADQECFSRIPGFLNPVPAGAAWQRALRCSTPRCWSRPD
jgi:hypothetical protein